MELIPILIFIVIFGVIVYLIDHFVPMAEPFKTIFRVVIILAICIFLLSMVGGLPSMHLNTGSFHLGGPSSRLGNCR